MMEVRSIELRKELLESYRDVKRQIAEVKKMANRSGFQPEQLRNEHGDFMLAPLLVAQVQVLHALTLLNQKEK
jgi:hypothetical protein